MHPTHTLKTSMPAIHVAYQAVLQGVRPDADGRHRQGPESHRLGVWSATETLGPFRLHQECGWDLGRMVRLFLKQHRCLPGDLTMVKFRGSDRRVLEAHLESNYPRNTMAAGLVGLLVPVVFLCWHRLPRIHLIALVIIVVGFVLLQDRVAHHHHHSRTELIASLYERMDPNSQPLHADGRGHGSGLRLCE